jgi:hypothetical protein
LLCAFGATYLVLRALTAVTSGWVETGLSLVAGLAAFGALAALLGAIFPGERDWYGDND